MQKHIRTKAAILLLPVLSLIFDAYPAQAAYNPSLTSSYLQSANPTAWATLGLAALGQSNISANHLKNIQATKAVDLEAPILALAASGKNPKTFPAQDYIAQLKSYATGGQLGDPATLNDDAFGLLALLAAGESQSSQLVVAEKNYLLSQQNQDGGFGLQAGGSSDTNMTSATICALVAAGLPVTDSKIQSALQYLRSAQNTDGGFPYDPTSQYNSSDADSTAWVIWALNASGISPASWTKNSHNPVEYLSSLQQSSGAFDTYGSAFSVTSAAYAAIALAGKTLPIISNQTPTQTFAFRIEGSQNTICEGQVPALTAMDVVTNAASQCGFTYTLTPTSYGPYLSAIGSDVASGNTGWQYAVNDTPGNVGADAYALNTGDTITWYFGAWDLQMARISLSSQQIASGGQANATVEYKTQNGWQPLSGATVYYSVVNTTTDNTGKATFTAPDGYYKIYAAKPGYVRTNSVSLQIGTPTSGNVALSADLAQGQVAGSQTPPPNSGISFAVDASSLDFGSLGAGQSSSKQLNLINQGSGNIQVAAVVTGDSVFKDGLKLENTSWKNFQAQLTGGQTQNVNVSLKAPAIVTSSGHKSGQLIFWATAGN